MPYKRCQQCKKRLSEKQEKIFCSDNCEEIYNNSSIITCRNCNKELGKSSVIKKIFCNNICANEYQKKSNQIERICIHCHKKFVVQKSSHRYKLCSIKCEKEYIKSEERNKKRIETLRKNNLNKYGVEFMFSIPSFHEKSKQTKLQKYNDENYNNREQAKQTCLEKYGYESILNVEEFLKKAKETKLKKYGTLNFNDKAKKTKLEKYGTFNFSEKSSRTVQERYGVKNAFLIATEKIRQELKEKYLKWLFDGDRLNNKVKPLFQKNEYIDNKYETKYNFQCLTCNEKFLDTLYSGHIPRCPKCYPDNVSKPQQEIIDYINSIYKGTIITNDRSIINGSELDIYLPQLKLAIEYNGLYWHGEINGMKNKQYHLNKTILCEQQNIKLIHIFEDEWFNKQSIVKKKLDHLLFLNKNKIYARCCEVKEIPFKMAYDFLEKYHLQGSTNSSIQIGAFYKNELVSVMTFGKQRIALGNISKENQFEMYRFCTGNNHVVGIASKLLSFFIKKYNPQKIVSYADRRWSNENSFYNKINFNFIRKTVPNYWYINKSGIRFHRFQFRKSELSKKLQFFNPSLSEWENMKNNGFDRIWDCGNLKYVWKNTNTNANF